MGEFLEINRRAVWNKFEGETSCNKFVKCAGLNVQQCIYGLKLIFKRIGMFPKLVDAKN